MKVVVILVVIAAIALGGIFINDYFDKSAAADSLAGKIQNENKILTTISSANQKLAQEIADLNNKASQATLDIAKESKTIPTRMNSNEIVKNVLDKGLDNNVTVIPLSTQDWSNVKIGKHSYQIFKMSVEVTGEQNSLISFMEDLQGIYDTLVIENASFNKTYATPTPTESPTPTITPEIILVTTKIKINLAVYAR